jgi:hypothetical protein
MSIQADRRGAFLLGIDPAMRPVLFRADWCTEVALATRGLLNFESPLVRVADLDADAFAPRFAEGFA